MTFNIDTDFALPLVVALLAVTLTIGHQTLVPKSAIDQLLDENAILFSEVSSANHEISILTHQLEEYHTTESSLESLGASHTQAVAVIKAAEVYGINPLTLGALCKTESEFTQGCIHDLPYVIGAFGISIKDHKDLPVSPYTFYGNAKCAAYILRQNLDKYNGNYKKALTAYKGICALGRLRANNVLRIERTIH